MLSFPSKAYVGRIMPKEAFYKRLTLNSELKVKFVSDVKRIVVEYKLTPETLNVEAGGSVTEILVLSVELKKQDFDCRIIENIAKQNAHSLLFVLKYEGQAQMALYYSKLYKTEWLQQEDITLEPKGLKLEDIWNGFVEQIAVLTALRIEHVELSIDEKLKRQEAILKLQKEIEKLERLARNEKQPKKKFELFQQLQDKKKKLVELQYD